MNGQPNDNPVTPIRIGQQLIGHQLLKQFDSTLPLHSLNQLTTLVAVSGGSDSVALAHWVRHNKSEDSKIILAHFNHQLRGVESDEDEAFVRRFAESLDCEIVVGRSDSPRQSGDETSTPFGRKASNRGQGLESLAREARYRFLSDSAAQAGARFVLTAHTQDDLIETLVHRFFRGTGIRGLTGIPPVRELLPGISLIRPFLGCTKELLLSYLKEHGLEFRFDPSNLSGQFTRNRIRNELIPLAKDIFENELDSSVLGLAACCGEITAWLDPQVEQLLQNFVRCQSHRVQVELGAETKGLSEVLWNELWIRIWSQMKWPRQQMNRQKWASITRLVSGESTARINLPGNLMAELRADQLIIWDASAPDPN